MAPRAGRSSTSSFVDSLISGVKGADADPEPAEDRRRPSIPIAQAMAKSAEGAFAKIAELEQQIQNDIDSGRKIVEIDPARITHARITDRAAGFEGDKAYDELRESIRKDGQLMPVGVRKLGGEGNDEYETCWGHRRIAACRDLERKVLAIVVKPSDVNAAVMGYAENARRKSTSFIEQGHFFAALLSNQLFASQHDVAITLQVSKTWVSLALSAAEIPMEILQAVGDWRKCTKRQAVALRRAMDLPNGLEKMRSALKEIASRKGGVDVKVERLVAAATPSVAQYKARRVHKDGAGKAFIALEKDNEGVLCRFAQGVDPKLVEFIWEKLPSLCAEFEIAMPTKPVAQDD
jgi:ParB family transcriptional regulator, chromosome partitioning protein